MGVFKDEHELYRYIGGIFEATVADPEGHEIELLHLP